MYCTRAPCTAFWVVGAFQRQTDNAPWSCMQTSVTKIIQFKDTLKITMSTAISSSGYVDYLHNYEKNLTRLLDEGRFEAFEKSYHWIDQRLKELNQSSASYRVAVNQFADWSRQEISDIFPVFERAPVGPRSKNWDSNLEAAAGEGQDDSDKSKSSFSTYLNWASSHNPIGVSILPGPRNQGACGACWAFVSVGSAEGAVSIATGHVVALSVQELVDCATEFNRGCSGGNPIFAYEYIRANGLSLWSEYPYADAQNAKCQSTKDFTKATINYDLEIPPNDEVELKWYVSKGPVAIGICATDMDFLYYGGGIFNPSSCCTLQNHAILIVGYGVEAESNVPYWIVQNSWGSIWGEEGYMRIKRSTARGAGPGVCGLATFPTMASGGRIMSGNVSAHPNSGNAFGEWLSDHNEQIISVFAAACFLLSIALLILSYWFSCRRRDADRIARDTASRIKLDVIR